MNNEWKEQMYQEDTMDQNKAVAIMDQVLSARSDGVEQSAWDYIKTLLPACDNGEKNMESWKEVRTADDIPLVGEYEWQYQSIGMDTWHCLHSEPVISIYKGEAITKLYRYRPKPKPKPYPSDEYIKAHLWYGGNFSKLTFQEAVISADSEIDIWGVTYSREWFKTASHIPKSAIKTEIGE